MKSILIILSMFVLGLNADIANQEFELRKKEYIEEIKPMVYSLSENENRAYIFFVKYYAETMLQDKGIKDKEVLLSDLSTLVNIISSLSNNKKNQKLYKDLSMLYWEIGKNLISKKEARKKYDSIDGEIKSSLNKETGRIVAKRYGEKIIYTAKIMHMFLDDVNSHMKSIPKKGRKY